MREYYTYPAEAQSVVVLFASLAGDQGESKTHR